MFSLVGLVMIVVCVPVIGATIGTIMKGEPIARPEFMKTAGDIVIYCLGIISGYVLGNKEKPPTQ